MALPETPRAVERPTHQPFVPEHVRMREFTWRAVILGLILTIILGAANAYLGLRAGVTIAATYPAAVISMAVLRLMRGTILEENLSRTAGSIGESVAAGAIFTLPAFLISRSWLSFSGPEAYWKSSLLMVMGGVLGVLFVSLVRRGMVEDPELPFPESVAAAEIHKAGQGGNQAARFLFYNMGLGALVYLLGVFKLFRPESAFLLPLGQVGQSTVPLGGTGTLNTGGYTIAQYPSISPAYIGVGYIIGPKLAALNFSGGVLAWGLLVPMLIYFLGPQLRATLPADAGTESWEGLAVAVWRNIVRPIAVGGMLVGAAYTLFRMRKTLTEGLSRAFSELRQAAPAPETLGRLDRYMSSRTVLGLIAVVFAAMIVVYSYLAGGVVPGVVAAIAMLITGFFFATVSGSLVGIIGSSNNPISGLTLSTVIIAGLLMVALGVSGVAGVTAVLGVAAVVCVSSAVAGELLQDFKAGYLLGGTPRTIQLVELAAVVVASLVMYFPLLVLHEGNIKQGGIGFGDPALAAPQASLMASISQGIVGGNLPWPLIGIGVMMGIGMILLQVRSPMLVAVGMYLPFGTTFAIFVGGAIRWLTDSFAERRHFNAAQRARVENIGVLTASGLIVGEGLMGLFVAWSAWQEIKLFEFFANPPGVLAAVALVVLAFVLVYTPIKNAGRPDEPAPPTAIV